MLYKLEIINYWIHSILIPKVETKTISNCGKPKVFMVKKPELSKSPPLLDPSEPVDSTSLFTPPQDMVRPRGRASPQKMRGEWQLVSSLPHDLAEPTGASRRWIPHMASEELQGAVGGEGGSQGSQKIISRGRSFHLIFISDFFSNWTFDEDDTPSKSVQERNRLQSLAVIRVQRT